MRRRLSSSHPFSTGCFLSMLCFISITGESAVNVNQIDAIEQNTEPVSNESVEPNNRPPKNITSFNLMTIESLDVVEGHIQDEDYAKAEQKLAEIWENETELTLSEQAELAYISSRISYIQQNVEATIGHLEKVLEYRDNISYAREEEVLLRLAELYLSEKEHVKAHSRLNEWLEIVENPKASELAFAGNLFVKIKSYSKAKEYLERAIEHQKEEGLEVDARWSELLDYVEKQLDRAN